MKRSCQIAQLLLRWALGIGFLLPVLDRLSFFGPPGDPHVAWGNWITFTAYTNQLMPYVNKSTASFFGLLATVIEVACAFMLIIGYKIRYAAWVSFSLTLIFALSMMIFLNFRAPFNYSVFVVAFSCLLLSTIPSYKWSIDTFAGRK